MFSRKEYDLRLFDINDPVRKQLSDLGGTYQVLVAGSPLEQAIYVNDISTSAASNPGSISGGQIRFFVDSSVESVDVIIYTDTGIAVFKQGVKPAGSVRNILIDPFKREQKLVLPMVSNSDSETDTGFTLVGPVKIKDIDVLVVTTDAGETLDIGLDGTTNNDPNGLVAGLSVAAAPAMPVVGPVISEGVSDEFYQSNTRGALLSVFFAGGGLVTGDVGVYTTKDAVVLETETDANVTYTESAGGDAFNGYMTLHLERMPT